MSTTCLVLALDQDLKESIERMAACTECIIQRVIQKHAEFFQQLERSDPKIKTTTSFALEHLARGAYSFVA